MLYFYIYEVCKFRTGKGGTLKVEAESRARGYVAAGQGVTQMRRDRRTKGGGRSQCCVRCHRIGFSDFSRQQNESQHVFSSEEVVRST